MNIQYHHLLKYSLNRIGEMKKETIRGSKEVPWWGICLHWFGNPNMDEWGHLKYFQRNTENRRAAYNYLVGDDVIEIIPPGEVSIHTNSEWYNENMVSIGCAHDKDGIFSDRTLKNMRELCAILLFKCNGSHGNISRHYDAVDQWSVVDDKVISKNCPKMFVDYALEYVKFRRSVQHELGHLNQLEE